MKQLFIKVSFFIAYYLGVIHLFYFLTRKRQRVVTYHNIIQDKYFNNSIEQGVSCSESVFRIQLKEIAKRFSFTTEINKENSCMITFDDGYHNNYEIAIPILDLHDIKAVFFITYNLVAKSETIWIDLIMKWYSYVPEGRYSVLGKKLIISEENRRKCFNNMLFKIYNDYNLKNEVLADLDMAFNFSELIKDAKYNKVRFSPISLVNIEKMKKSNHLIACHTISHDVLSELPNDLLDIEIKKSENYIGKLYNTNYFAYPFGGTKDVSKKVMNRYSVSEFNYCFVNYWNFSTSTSKPKCLERVTLPNTANKYVIHAYLSGFYFFFKRKISHV